MRRGGNLSKQEPGRTQGWKGLLPAGEHVTRSAAAWRAQPSAHLPGTCTPSAHTASLRCTPQPRWVTEAVTPMCPSASLLHGAQAPVLHAGMCMGQTLTAPTSVITPEPGNACEGATNSCGRGGGEENLADGREGGLMKYPVF